jgi:hypothetical protein
VTASSRVGLVTFAAGLPHWRAAGQRLVHQAERSGWFNKIALVTDRTLARDHGSFWQENQSFLTPRTRGFGYWIWKPYLIGHALHEWSNDVDFVLYLDAGCEINVSQKSAQRWLEYLEMAQEGSGRFAMSLRRFPEHDWSKMDTMGVLGLTPSQQQSGQIESGAVLLKVSQANIEFCNEWLRICREEDYHFVDDSPSRLANVPSFREHRHDQAIFSGLAKRCGISTIPGESFWAPNWEEKGGSYPIWSPRNRTRFSILDQRVSANTVRFVERAYSKLYRDVLGRKRR